MGLLSGISITCFAASYTIVLALELSRLAFQSAARGAVLFAFAVIGLFTHTVYLANEIRQATTSAALSSWYDWFLVAAWVLAAVYLYLAAAHPRQALGVFLLPLVLCLVAAAHFWADRTTFSPDEARRAWATVHGISLLLGTVVVSLGFAAGLMYLVQDYRLKHKRPLGGPFRLPTLEWLDRANVRCLAISVLLLALGLLSGVVWNQINHLDRSEWAFPWSDPVVWTSGLLFLWLAAVTIFGAAYRPARVGRKVAYLTLASFAFLMMVLAVLLFAPSEHGRGGKVESGNSKVEMRERRSFPLSTLPFPLWERAGP